jgi:spermidine synthase
VNATRQRAAVLPGATISEFDGVRYLHLGTEWVQGAMRIRKPRALELEYIQRMMVWLLLRPLEGLEQGHAVQLGLGAAAITRFTSQVLRMRTTAVELNPTVVQACRLWFHLPADDARLSVVSGDAGRWIAQAAPESIDALAVDIYDQDAAAPALDDVEFYAQCRSALTGGGLMTVNLFGRDASFDRSSGRIAQAFGASQVWQMAPTKEGNTIVVAGRDVVVPDRATLTARADAVEVRFGLPARKWLRLLRPWRADDAAGRSADAAPAAKPSP